MARDQEFVPPLGPGDAFLNGCQIRQSMQAGGKTGVVERQVQDISAQATNPLGKRIVRIGDDQTVELTGTISEKLLGRCHRMTTNVNLSHSFSFDAFRSLVCAFSLPAKW
jgi:hypothetical protein